MTKGRNRQIQRRQVRKALKYSDLTQISGRKLARIRHGEGAGRQHISDDREISRANRTA